VLEAVQQHRRSSWAIVFTTTPAALADDVLTIAFPTEADASAFKHRAAPADSVSEHVRTAIQQVLGVRVKFIVRVDAAADAAPAPAAPAATPAAPAASAPPKPAAQKPAPKQSPAAPAAAPVTDWVVAPIPTSAAPASAAPASGPAAPSPVSTPSVASAESPASAPEPATTESATAEPATPERAAPPPTATAAPHPAEVDGRQRYGEAVVREVLGATFLAEETIAPLVTAGAVELPADAAEAVPAAPRDGDLPSSADAPDPFRDEY
jgi:DNA polymerase-3 subunit gamma/tau